MKLSTHGQIRFNQKQKSKIEVSIRKLVQTIVPIPQNAMLSEELGSQMHNMVSDLVWQISLINRETRCPYENNPRAYARGFSSIQTAMLFAQRLMPPDF